MTKPLALVVYEQLMPGSQLVNRLQDLGYRVQVLTEPAPLRDVAEREKALVVVMDLVYKHHDPGPCISDLRKHPATAHIPILAYAPSNDQHLAEVAQAAGVTLIASEAAILSQLPRLLDRALEVE